MLNTAAVDQEFLAIPCHRVRSNLPLHAHYLEQNMRNTESRRSARCVHIHRNQVVGRIEKVQFFAVAAPSHVGAAVGGNLPPRAAAGKWGNVNLRTSGLVVLIDHPFSTRRHHGIQVIKRRMHHREPLAIAGQGQRPDVGLSFGIVQEPPNVE